MTDMPSEAELQAREDRVRANAEADQWPHGVGRDVPDEFDGPTTSAEEFLRTVAPEGPDEGLRVQCPTCGVQPGVDCHSRDGQTLVFPTHKRRREAACSTESADASATGTTDTAAMTAGPRQVGAGESSTASRAGFTPASEGPDEGLRELSARLSRVEDVARRWALHAEQRISGSGDVVHDLRAALSRTATEGDDRD